MLQFFEAQSWPGNVRELEHVIEASMNLVNYEQVIEFDHLPYQYRKSEVKMAASSPEFTESMEETMGLTDQLALFEKQTIEHYLHKHHSHITNTAIALGISRQSLQYRMKRLDIRVQKI